MIWKTILNLLYEKIIGALISWIQEVSAKKKLKKQVTKKVKEIMNEKDPRTRAKRLKDLLG